jgi:hypothetical protein
LPWESWKLQGRSPVLGFCSRLKLALAVQRELKATLEVAGYTRSFRALQPLYDTYIELRWGRRGLSDRFFAALLRQRSLSFLLRLRRLDWRAHLAVYRRQSLANRNPVLVHQMAKVGSSTVLASLRPLLGARVVQVHNLSIEGLRHALHSVAVKREARVPEIIWHGRYFAEYLAKGGSPVDWRIITLVRDPVARNISGFFQNIEKWRPGAISLFQSGRLDISELCDCFLEAYPHELPLQWFDKEIKAVFGIDLLELPFDAEAGFSIHATSPRVLLIKLERLNDVGEVALGDFVGLGRIPLLHENVAEDKRYRDLYRAFVKEARLPREYLDRMYGSRYARHFYTEAELFSFRERWGGGC